MRNTAGELRVGFPGSETGLRAAWRQSCWRSNDVAADPAVLISFQEAMDALDRFAEGDQYAFETVFRQYQGEIYGWIVRMVREPAAAEDLTVETFWRIYKLRKRFDARRPFGPWARRIASRLAIDYLRSRQRFAVTSLADTGELIVPHDRRDPAVQGELRAQIERAFCRLPPKLRAAATLALIEERPYDEIADGLGISLSAVKMRVARAVRRLRASLEKLGIRP